jgi:hypothetical protein
MREDLDVLRRGGPPHLYLAVSGRWSSHVIAYCLHKVPYTLVTFSVTVRSHLVGHKVA